MDEVYPFPTSRKEPVELQFFLVIIHKVSLGVTFYSFDSETEYISLNLLLSIPFL